MPVTLFKGDGPCPACRQVIAELDRAGIQFELNEDNADLFHVGNALGLKMRPILVWAAGGAGRDSEELIEGLLHG